MTRRLAIVAAAALAVFAGPVTPAGSAGPAPTASLTLVAAGSDFVDAAWRTGDPTVFVVAQSGQILPLRGTVLGAAVLDISDEVTFAGEQGLLGLAFSLDGSHAYVNYINRDGDTVVAEYPVDASGAFGARRILFTEDQPYDNHNGGDLVVAADGTLYIGFGDGGAGGDPERRAMRLDTRMGKLLRIDPTPSGDRPFTIPADNPFVGVDGALGEIWALGLRNPWRFSIDRATGDLWIADVGQNTWEEINLARGADGGGRGLNFGWSAFEGTHEFNGDVAGDGVTMPIYEYEHGDRGCSITGGVVAHDPALPALDGWFVYADHCSGQVRGLHVTGTTVDGDAELAKSTRVSAVVDGPDGAVYILSLQDGILRLTPPG